MASTATTIPDRSVSVGRILSRAFATMGSNPGTVFGISFAFGALPGLILNYGASMLGYSQQNLTAGVITPLFFFSVLAVTALLGIAFSMLTQGALVRATVAHSEGRDASFGEAAAAGLRVILPLFVLGILFGLGIMLGLFLLIVPGIILCTMWAVAAPALVEERTGVFGAFGRSRYLTKGARWQVFAIGLMMIALYWAFSALIAALVFGIYGMGELQAITAQGLPIAWLAVSGLITTVLTAIITTMQTSLYVELREWKDGPATAVLTEVFA
ncbi:MAG: hypothetical protein V4472_04820 [Pseudomonadota bacterium]